jgi:hypothetical protein
MIPRTFESVPTWSVNWGLAVTGNEMPPRDPNDDDDDDAEEDEEDEDLEPPVVGASPMNSVTRALLAREPG